MRDVFVRDLGTTHYPEIFLKMRDYSRARDSNSNDEIWVTEHNAVFTLGQAAKKEHLIAPGSIPVYQSDRGGQVTYHGPAQLAVYLLVDIKRLSISVRQLVDQIESVMIGCVANYNIKARRLSGAPGVYVDNKKIAIIGDRILTDIIVGNRCNIHTILVKKLNKKGVPIKINLTLGSMLSRLRTSVIPSSANLVAT